MSKPPLKICISEEQLRWEDILRVALGLVLERLVQATFGPHVQQLNCRKAGSMMQPVRFITL